MDRLVLPSGNEPTQLFQGDLATTLFYNTQDVFFQKRLFTSNNYS